MCELGGAEGRAPSFREKQIRRREKRKDRRVGQTSFYGAQGTGEFRLSCFASCLNLRANSLGIVSLLDLHNTQQQQEPQQLTITLTNLTGDWIYQERVSFSP